jgi:hypothetical protein
MIYTVANDSQNGWYASFQKTNIWKINKVCGGFQKMSFCI